MQPDAAFCRQPKCRYQPGRLRSSSLEWFIQKSCSHPSIWFLTFLKYAYWTNSTASSASCRSTVLLIRALAWAVANRIRVSSVRAVTGDVWWGKQGRITYPELPRHAHPSHCTEKDRDTIRKVVGSPRKGFRGLYSLWMPYKTQEDKITKEIFMREYWGRNRWRGKKKIRPLTASKRKG